MKKFLIIIFIIIFINMGYTAFEDLGYDTRAKGMGNAFYSVEGGVSSIYYNPAATAFSKKAEVNFNFGLPYAGFEYINMNVFNFSFLVPFTKHFKYKLAFENTVFGFAFNSFSLFYENSTYFDDDNIDYSEKLMKINLAQFKPDLLGEGSKLSYGVNLNIFLRSLGENIDTQANSSYFVNGLSASGFGLDLGFMLILNPNMTVGVAFDNFIEPNIAFNKNLSGGDFVDRRTKIGFTWKSHKLWKFKYPTISGGIAFENLKSNVWEYRVGYEFWEFKKMLGARLGYEVSDEGMNQISLGLTGQKSFGPRNIHNVQLHYAFVLCLSGLKDNYGSHTWSLTYNYTFPDYIFDFRTDAEIEEENKTIEYNYKKGIVIVKYKTLPNDNLFNISLINYGTPAQAELIQKHNKIEDPTQLPPVLEIPYNAKAFELYKIQPGDTLSSIAEKFYGDPEAIEKILRFNKIPFSRLRPGRILVIPKEEIGGGKSKKQKSKAKKSSKKTGSKKK